MPKILRVHTPLSTAFSTTQFTETHMSTMQRAFEIPKRDDYTREMAYKQFICFVSRHAGDCESASF